MKLTIKPTKIISFLGSVIILLIVCNTISMLTHHFLKPEVNSTLFYLAEYFNFLSENNFPTYFSSLQLVFSAAVLGLIGVARNRQAAGDSWQWFGLGLIFLFLSLDESLMIHEVVAVKIRHHIQLTGIFFYAWIIPYSLFALAVLIVYIPFLQRLPRTIKIQMLLAGFVFVFGAIGMEAIESWYFTATGGKDTLKDPLYMFMAAIEETMEIVGILLFLKSLLQYIVLTTGEVSISLSEEEKVTAIGPATQRLNQLQHK